VRQMRRWVVWTAFARAATGSGCDGTPDIAITTAIPINAPAGQNERLLYAMCSDVGRYENAHIKVMYYHHPDGRRAFTVVPFCSDILKRYAKYRD
jgi:hypothetical protein